MDKAKIRKYVPLVCAILLLVLGVLFCFEKSMGWFAISVIMGAGIIVLGLVLGVYAAVNTKSTLVTEVLLACAIVALGIFIIVENIAETVMAIIPWLLVTVGVCAIIDAFLAYFVRKGEKKAMTFALELTCGAVAVTAGFCVHFVEKIQDFMSVAFGIALIVFAIYIFVGFCVKAGEERKADKGKKKPVEVVEVEVAEEEGEADKKDKKSDKKEKKSEEKKEEEKPEEKKEEEAK